MEIGAWILLGAWVGQAGAGAPSSQRPTVAAAAAESDSPADQEQSGHEGSGHAQSGQEQPEQETSSQEPSDHEAANAKSAAADSNATGPAIDPSANGSSGPSRGAAPATLQPPGTKLVPLDTLAPQSGSADALVRILASPERTALEGQPVSLVEIVGRVADRGQQIGAVQTYWRLSAAMADYRVAADEAGQFGQLLPPPDASGQHPSDPLLEARLASAEARLRETELALVAEQFSLAEIARWPTSGPPILAGDLPHVGPYRTYFQERYVHTAPPKAHLLDRSLPLLHRSIELRAMAAVAAADAVEADLDAYHAQKVDLAIAIDSITDLARQRRAFVAATRDYNLDIAEYALTVVPGGLSSAQLVGLLIGPSQPAAAATPTMAAEPPPVKRAGFDQPIPAASSQPSPASASPMGSAPRSAPGKGLPGRAPRRVKSTGPGGGQSRRSATAGRRHMAAKPATGESAGDQAVSDEASDQSFTHSLGGASEEAAPAGKAVVAPIDGGLYAGLIGLAPPQRLSQLAAALHWYRQPAEPVIATTLSDAISAAGPANRRAVIGSYWEARDRIAALEIRVQQASHLAGLQAAALAGRNAPDGAEAMLRLRAARLATDAAVAESQAAVLASQFELAAQTRRPLTGAWPWPTTPPHAGNYRLKTETLSEAIRQTPTARWLTTAIPAIYQVLLQRAAAVIEAEEARALATSHCEAGHAPLDEAIAATEHAADEAVAFLASQTNYNQRFADYVLAVAPPDVSDATLAGVLVVSGGTAAKQ